MRKEALIAGLILMVVGLLLTIIPVSTPYQVSVSVPYEYTTSEPYEVATPEYKWYLVGTIETLGGPIQIGTAHRIVNISVEFGAHGTPYHSVTIWNDWGHKFIYNWVTSYDLDWEKVQTGTRSETLYQTKTRTGYRTEYETRYRMDYPFAIGGWILFLVGIPVAAYGAASKPSLAVESSTAG